MGRRYRSKGAQKVDHGGNFIQTPRKMITSLAWLHLSNRARAALQIIQSRHKGYNNGHIALGIHAISEALGDQNHRASSRAVAECIKKGFLECTCDFDRRQSKVREYRLTFISTGYDNNAVAATNEYLDWRPNPESKRKFGGARTATKMGNAIADTALGEKLSIADAAPKIAENAGVLHDACGAKTAPLIGNQSVPVFLPLSGGGTVEVDGPVMDLPELRSWVRAAIANLGYGGQRILAREASIPE